MTENSEKLNREISKLRPFSRKLVLRVEVFDLAALEIKKTKDTTRKKYKDLCEQGFKSIVRITDPTPVFFEMLIQHKHVLGVHKPWVIELYKDILFESEQSANQLADKLIDTSYKKNSTHTFLYVAFDPYRRNKKRTCNLKTEDEFENWRLNEDIRQRDSSKIFGKKTLYLGEDDFTFVIYARNSKRGAKPCVHLEWRILWSQNYKMLSKLGIKKKNTSYLGSLKNLTEFHIVDMWENLTSKYIKNAEINEEKVGKQLADCKGCPKSFDNMEINMRARKQLTDDEKRNLRFKFHIFKKIHGIETTSEFVHWWHEERELGKEAKEKSTTLHYSKFLTQIDLM